MTSEERFKKSLEDLLETKDFSFDEANWDKAKDIIDASKKRKKRIVPFILAGILLITCLTTGFFLLGTSYPTDQKVSTTKTKAIPSTFIPAEPKTILRINELPSEAAVVKAGPALSNASTILSKTAPGKTQSKPQAEIETINSNPAREITTEKVKESTSKSIESSNVNTKVLALHNASPAKRRTKQKSSEEEKSAAQQINSSVLKDLPESEIETPAVEPEQSVTKENSDLPEVTPTVESKETTEQSLGSTSLTENKKLEDANVQASKVLKETGFASDVTLPVNSTSEKSEEAPAQNQVTIPAGSGNAATEKENEPAKELSSTLTVAGITDSTKVVAPDSVASPTDNDEGELGKKKESPILFSIEAGANYMLGWQNSGDRDARGFSPVIGINYFNNFTSKLALTVGLQFTSITNLSFSSYTSKVTRLALGEESQVSVFTPLQVQYLIVPLRLDYRITPKNSVGVGCNIAYLLNVKSDVETYQEKLGAKYDETHSKTYGYTKGFKQYDTQVSVFYKRILHPNLALNMEFYYGLTDIKDNSFFNSKVTERNSGIKLTLVYNFLKK